MMAADEAGIAHVFLLDFLLAGEDRLFGVDHDDEVAGIDVAGEDGLVLAAQQHGGLFGDAADHLVFGINHKPLTFDLFGLGTKSFHREPSIKPAGARGVKDILVKIKGVFGLCANGT